MQTLICVKFVLDKFLKPKTYTGYNEKILFVIKTKAVFSKKR